MISNQNDVTAQGLPLTLRVEETAVLPRVSTPEEVRDHPGGCFCELLPRSELSAEALFPGHVALRTGEKDAPAWWSDHESNVAALNLFKLRDVYLFPAFGVVICRDGAVMRLPMEDASYFSPDLSALPCIEARDGGTVFTVPETVEFIERSALTMALGANRNYGHFLLDCLPAACSMRKTGAFADFPFHFPALEPWQKRHLALLDIKPVELAGDVYRVGEIVYTSGMHHYLHTPNFNYAEVKERQIAGVAAPPARSPKRLYLSRANYASRVMASESELRGRLTSLGFTPVDPGTMSVDQQITLFRGAEVIVGSAGAAFANVLYCRPETLIIEIQPAGMENQWVRNICLQNRCRFIAYFCDMLEGHPTKPEVDLRYDIDVDRFMTTISGFAPLNSPALPAGWLLRLTRALGLAGPPRSSR